MTIKIPNMSLTDFMRKYSDEGAFEIINGEIISMSPQSSGSGNVSGNLYFHLRLYCQHKSAGVAFIEVPFVLTDHTDWVKGSRVPDVMFYAQDRFDTYDRETPDRESKPMMIVPDFVAETISPSDRFSDVNRKVQTYLDDGVKLVWVIDPQAKTVHTHTPDGVQNRIVKGDAVLSADSVITGFEIKLSDLFAK